MKIAVVGATGNIGSRLTRKLLEAGHEVRALSRGGAALDNLVKLGAEPFIGSFDEAKGDIFRFFEGAHATFTMVKTDWNNIHGHYAAVSKRLATALRRSSVELVVNLSSFGGDVAEGTGHFVGFYELEQGLNSWKGPHLVHLRAGYFMENVLAWTEAVARHGRIAYYFDPDVKLPVIATRDIADIAFEELMKPADYRHTVREVGGENLSKKEMAKIISDELGRPVDYVAVSMESDDIKQGFVSRFGTEEKWLYDVETHEAMNDGRVRLNPGRPPVATTFATFVRDTWKPAYEKSAAERNSRPNDFRSWLAGFTIQEEGGRMRQ